MWLINAILFQRYQDPFEEYKNRQEKKRAKKAEAEEKSRVAPIQEKKDSDELNWFGVKLGMEMTSSAAAGQVGKYLQTKSTAPKRPASSVESSTTYDEGKKKRKVGFGEFEGW